jgi:hypothetical protein
MAASGRLPDVAVPARILRDGEGMWDGASAGITH